MEDYTRTFHTELRATAAMDITNAERVHKKKERKKK